MKKLFYLFVLTTSVAFSQQTKFRKIDSLLTFLNTNNKFMGSIALSENNKIVFASELNCLKALLPLEIEKNNDKCNFLGAIYMASYLIWLI